MRKWTAKDYRTMPWKNGGGSTTELAIYPEGAGIDNFVWRLSTATVSQSGPFSHFSQIDRTLAVLSGEGIELFTNRGTESERSIRLTQTSEPHRFSGEDKVDADLCTGTVVDLNLMTRRDVCQHYMQRLTAGEHVVRAEDAQQMLLFCEQGNATIAKDLQLEAGDLLLLEEENEDAGIRCHIDASEFSILYLMRISFLNRHEQHGGKHVLG
jgi:hypothetical protein